MDNLLLYSIIMLASVLISSISQILLKISTKLEHKSRIEEYLNPFVLFAYGLFFISTFVTMYALKGIPLAMAPILESSGYIFVALLSKVILKEQISLKKLFGLCIILIGICIYTL